MNNNQDEKEKLALVVANSLTKVVLLTFSLLIKNQSHFHYDIFCFFKKMYIPLGNKPSPGVNFIKLTLKNLKP